MEKLKYLLFSFLLLLFLVSISLSQTEASEPILTISLKQVYSTSEEINISFWFGFSNSTPLQNSSLNISLISENLKYNIIHQTNENGEAYIYFPNLAEGNYNLTVVGIYEGKEFMNFSSFVVKEVTEENETLENETINFNISTQKEKYSVNESVGFDIHGPKNTSFLLLIEGSNLNMSFELQTDENGSCQFSQTFYTPGNYSARINEAVINFEVVEEKIEKNLSLEMKKEISLNESIEFNISGTPETNFSLEVIAPTNLTIFSIFAKTDENGIFKTEFQSNQTGTYSVNLSFEGGSILDYFEVKEEKTEFKISTQKEEFLKGEQIDFAIFGPANVSFQLSLEGPIKILSDLNTDESGQAIFSTVLNETGNYTAKVIYEGHVYEKEFSVIEERNLEISVLEIKQGEARIGEPVIWNKSMMVKNLMDSNVSISISDLGLPEEAALLLLEDEEGILNNSLQLLPNQSKILKVQYQTPAPIKIESEPEILNQTWIKRINVSSNSSLIYSNVSISSEVDPRVENLTLIFEGIDVTLNDSFEFQFNGTANWKIPELKEAHFELIGSIAQKNVSLQGKIKIENQKDFVFDCNGERIEGNSEKDSYGILVLNSENVTITNCIVSGFEIGIFVKDSNQIKLLNNTAERNEQGIVFLNSNHNTLVNNIAETNAYHGLIFYSSDGNYLENNRIKSNFDIKILEKLDSMLKG